MDCCTRCDGEMESGFMLDKGDYNATHQAQWASGNPQPSFWRLSAAKPDSEILGVVTFRCKSCGRLESFAHPTA